MRNALCCVRSVIGSSADVACDRQCVVGLLSPLWDGVAAEVAPAILRWHNLRCQSAVQSLMAQLRIVHDCGTRAPNSGSGSSIDKSDSPNQDNACRRRCQEGESVDASATECGNRRFHETWQQFFSQVPPICKPKVATIREFL
jgi:hypothetical protein